MRYDRYVGLNNSMKLWSIAKILQRKEKIHRNIVFSFGCAFSESREEKDENSV